jgi:hypothetical protein
MPGGGPISPADEKQQLAGIVDALEDLMIDDAIGAVSRQPEIGHEIMLQGKFRFPVFSAPPSVSVQIISSIGAVPMQVKTLKMVEIPGDSGPVETQIVVEAETIVDAPPGGFYYANLVVTGVPLTPPTISESAQLLH